MYEVHHRALKHHSLRRYTGISVRPSRRHISRPRIKIKKTPEASAPLLRCVHVNKNFNADAASTNDNDSSALPTMGQSVRSVDSLRNISTLVVAHRASSSVPTIVAMNEWKERDYSLSLSTSTLDTGCGESCSRFEDIQPIATSQP